MKKGILIFLAVSILAVIPLTGSSCGVSKPEKPEIRDISFAWGAVTAANTEILGTIMVYNPNSVTLPIKTITCDISMDGIAVGQAETVDLELGKNSEFPINISAKIDNSKIPSFWAEHINRKEISEISIQTHTTFDLGFMNVTIPYTINKPITTDILSFLGKVPPVTVEKKANIAPAGETTVFKVIMQSLSGTWGTATPDSAQLNITANINNDNTYPLLAPKVRCVVASNGLILSSGETTGLSDFQPKSSKSVDVSALFNTGLMDDWFVQHIQHGEISDFNIKVYLIFDVPDDVQEFFSQSDLSLKLWEGTSQVETDILGNKAK